MPQSVGYQGHIGPNILNARRVAGADQSISSRDRHIRPIRILKRCFYQQEKSIKPIERPNMKYMSRGGIVVANYFARIDL
jgi:hypothetical protein